MTASLCGCQQPSSFCSIRDLFAKNHSAGNTTENASFLKVSAPMVRYSQLPFRLLARKYGCDIAFSPMIVAQSFAASEKARLVDFSTCPADRPLVVQFGVTNSNDLVDAAGHVVQFADGIDINCGCPQKWAIKEGMGCALLGKPELLRDMVLRLKNAFPSGQLDHEVTTSIKIRINSNVKVSVNFAQQLTKTGLDFISIHGRTMNERSGDLPHWDIVSTINDLALRPAGCPLIVNGLIRTLDEAREVVKLTGADGVMAAEQMLRNPAMFSEDGHNQTPKACIADFLSLAKSVPNIENDGDKGHNLKFEIYRKHLTEMIAGSGIYGRRNKAVRNFNQLKTGENVEQWVRENVLEKNLLLDDNLLDDGDDGDDNL